MLLLLCLFFLLVVPMRIASTSAPTSTYKPRTKRILIVSLGILGHAIPMARIGAELVSQCCSRYDNCIVDFASHAPASVWWQEETIAVKASFCLGKFIDLGPMNNTWYKRLAKISSDPSLFRGTLSVFESLYMEIIPDIYENIDPHMRIADLAFIDYGTMGAVEKARALNISLVIHSPTIWADTFAQFEPPHWLPAFGSGLTKNMSLMERCFNALLPRLLSVALQPALMRINKLRYSNGLPPYFSSHQVFQDLRIVSSTALGFEYPRVVPPLHAYVGPMLPKRIKPHTLPRHIRAFVEKNIARKLILVRFKSVLNPNFLSLLSFKRGLEWYTDQTNVSVLWYSTAKDLRKFKTNSTRFLYLTKFDVDTHLSLLKLNVTSLYISSCGMAAVQEPLYFGVPVICVPLVADQADIAARLHDSGAGIVLHKDDINPDNVFKAVARAMSDENIDKDANTIRTIFRMAGGRERAALHVLSAFAGTDEDFYQLKRSWSWHKRVGVDVSVVVVSFHIIVGTTLVLFFRWRYSRFMGF